MRSLFEYVPEAIENTVKIAERCNVVFPEIDDAKNRVYFLPVFKWTEGLSHYDYLRKLTFEGFDKRYTKEQQTPELIERVEYELSIINKMGFVDYFLIVWDFINYAKEHGIPVIENPPVARAIFRMVEINAVIPPELYKAVAEILIFVYNLRNTGKSSNIK